MPPIRDFAKRQKANERAVRDWAWYIYAQKVLNRYKEGDECDDEQGKKLAKKMMLKNLRSSKIENIFREKIFKTSAGNHADIFP